MIMMLVLEAAVVHGLLLRRVLLLLLRYALVTVDLFVNESLFDFVFELFEEIHDVSTLLVRCTVVGVFSTVLEVWYI